MSTDRRQAAINDALDDWFRVPLQQRRMLIATLKYLCIVVEHTGARAETKHAACAACAFLEAVEAGNQLALDVAGEEVDRDG